MNHSQRDLAELSRLVLQMSDGELTAAELARLEQLLLNDPEAQAFYREQIALDVHLGWISASTAARGFQGNETPTASPEWATTPNRVTRPADQLPVGHFHWRIFTASLLAAAACFVVIILLLRPIRLTSPMAPAGAVARLVELNGAASVASDTGEGAPAGLGQEIFAGQTLRTGNEESFAAIEYSDKTRLEMGANTKVHIARDQTRNGEIGKKIRVSEGVVRVEASLQPDEQPLLVSAPHADIRVQGTRFLLSSLDPQATRIDLEAGKVDLMHPNGGPMVEVTAGSYALATAGPEAVSVQPLPRVLTVPHRNLGVASSRFLACLADGRLLMAAPDHMMVWSAEGVAQIIPLPGRTIYPGRTSCSRGGDMLALSAKDGRIFIWDLPRQEDRQVLDTGELELHLALSPDGDRLATVSNSTREEAATIQIWDVHRRVPQQVVEIEKRHVHCLAFSPDGQWLAAGTGKRGPREQSILLLDPATGQQRGSLPAQVRHVMRLKFSTDSRWLAGTDEDGMVQVWDMTTQTLQWAVRGGRQFGCVAFTPDGRFLAAGDTSGRVWIWNVVTGAECLVIEVSNKWMWGLAFSPDGRTLATAGHSSPVLLWDVGLLWNEP